MKAKLLGCHYNVTVLRHEVEAFNSHWPCSSLPERTITFQFNVRNGDLVDIMAGSATVDGPEAVALSHDAQEFGKKALGL